MNEEAPDSTNDRPALSRQAPPAGLEQALAVIEQSFQTVFASAPPETAADRDGSGERPGRRHR